MKPKGKLFIGLGLLVTNIAWFIHRCMKTRRNLEWANNLKRMNEEYPDGEA